jgi:hypothetical protein
MKIREVLKYTVRHKKLAFGGEPDDEILASRVLYDIAGNVLEEVRFQYDEGIYEKNIYQYNEQGKLLRHELQLGDDGFGEHLEYTRDDKQRLISEQKYYGDDPGERTEFHYENHDFPVKVVKFDADGIPEQTEVLLYDDKFNLVQSHKFDGEGKLTERSEIAFDDNNRPVSKTLFDEDNQIVKITTLEYDENGEPLHIRELSPERKLISEVISVYNEQGLVAERRIRDYHSRILRFKYDERRNCIEEEILDEQGNLSMKLTYEFDEQNRLISDSAYYLDSGGTGRASNSMSRYEYSYYDEKVAEASS